MSHGSGDEGNDLYIVESILAESHDKQKDKIYLIKWEGFDLYESTWEPLASFEEGAEQAIIDWAEIKELRATGELPDFNVEDFANNRKKWIEEQQSKQTDNVSMTDDATTGGTFRATSNDKEDISEAEEDRPSLDSPTRRERRGRSSAKYISIGPVRVKVGPRQKTAGKTNVEARNRGSMRNADDESDTFRDNNVSDENLGVPLKEKRRSSEYYRRLRGNQRIDMNRSVSPPESDTIAVSGKSRTMEEVEAQKALARGIKSKVMRARMLKSTNLSPVHV